MMLFSSLGLFMVLLGAILIGYYLFGNIFFRGELIAGLILLLGGILLIAILGVNSVFDAYNTAKEK